MGALQQAVAKQTAAADDAALKLAETACHFQEVKARYLERGGVLDSRLAGQKAWMDSLRERKGLPAVTVEASSRVEAGKQMDAE